MHHRIQFTVGDLLWYDHDHEGLKGEFKPNATPAPAQSVLVAGATTLNEVTRFVFVKHYTIIRHITGTLYIWILYSETWELGTPKGLPKTVLNSKVVLFLRFIPMY